MQIIPLRVGDRIQMKKIHPCGSNFFCILRVGGEMRVKCEGCGRDMTIDRIKLEKSIRKNLTAAENRAAEQESR